MPMPHVYNEPVNGYPMPFLKIDRRMRVIAVDEEGVFLASITGKNGYSSLAKQAIENDGYSTAWAEWDKDGRFVALK